MRREGRVGQGDGLTCSGGTEGKGGKVERKEEGKGEKEEGRKEGREIKGGVGGVGGEGGRENTFRTQTRASR